MERPQADNWGCCATSSEIECHPGPAGFSHDLRHLTVVHSATRRKQRRAPQFLAT